MSPNTREKLEREIGMARPKDFADVVSRIPGVRVTGNKAIAPCPLPGHKTPEGHLTLKDARDKALITDQGGRHTYEDICQALGFDSLTYNGNGSEAKITATYDYTDADGKLLYQVVRYDPKDFKQRRPDGTGDWLWNIKGVKPVLYRLPEVLEAVKQGKTVYICEGERDCDNLAKLGLSATTNSGGAEKWRLELSEALADASVVILPDKDAPGKRHAEKVASSLYGKVKSLKVLELPDRDSHQVKDASDWLGTNGTLSELEKLVSEAKAYSEKDNGLVDMSTVEVETVNWLWWPYIPLGKLTLLEGDPGVGKSWVSLAIATAISLGKGLLGMEMREPARVLIATAEDGLGDTIRPRLNDMKADVYQIDAIKDVLDFSNSGLAVLEGYIKQVKPALVVIDPLVAYIGARVDMHRANETRAILAKLADMAERNGCAILAIRHLTKGGTLKPIYRGQGSIDFAAACRSMLMAGCDPENEQSRGIVQIKSNLAPKGKAIGFELRDGLFYWTGESDLTWQRILSAEDTDSKSARDEAADFIREELKDGPVEAAQVWRDAREAGLSEITVKRAKAMLGVITERHGEVGRRGAGKFTWELPDHLGGQNDLEYHQAHIEKNDTLNQISFENGPLQKRDDTLNPPDALGIPCNKAEGFCSLSTGKETFSCIYQPEECPFFKGAESA